MMKLYSRNYLDGLTKEEDIEYKHILQKEKEGIAGFGRKNLYTQYPLAARCYLSLFPNNHLDILDLDDANEPIMADKTEGFKQLISSSNINEREILNYINQTPAFHIIGSILRGCNFRFGHHSAYLFPEFPLGTTYKADYLMIGKNSGGYEFVFVELESLIGNITIGQGNLGEVFRKGIAQAKEWNRCIVSKNIIQGDFYEFQQML